MTCLQVGTSKPAPAARSWGGCGLTPLPATQLSIRSGINQQRHRPLLGEQPMTRQMPACPPGRVLPARQQRCTEAPGGPFAKVTSQALEGELSAH